MGALALPVATAIVPQNTRGVHGIEPLAPALLRAQIESVLQDIAPDAVKIGMVPGASVEVLAELLRGLRGVPIVLDTVFAPSSGPLFHDGASAQLIARELLPLATVITPNALEARALGAGEIRDLDEMKRAAQLLHARTGARYVLLKGGHVARMHFSTDVLFDGAAFLELSAPRVGDYEVRGTGCLLAAALASNLARGQSVPDAARHAKTWLTRRYEQAHAIGGGRRVAA